MTALVPPRAEQLADELAMPANRIVATGFVKAMLSQVSSIEGWLGLADHPISQALDVAHLLRSRLP